MKMTQKTNCKKKQIANLSEKIFWQNVKKLIFNFAFKFHGRKKT